jgi:hypothetical protein
MKCMKSSIALDITPCSPLKPADVSEEYAEQANDIETSLLTASLKLSKYN